MPRKKLKSMEDSAANGAGKTRVEDGESQTKGENCYRLRNRSVQKKLEILPTHGIPKTQDKQLTSGRKRVIKKTEKEEITLLVKKKKREVVLDEGLSIHEATKVLWGPYLSERQWGTVREDRSLDGNCWEDFSYEDSLRRVYCWGEDGLFGVSDDQCRLCMSLAVWNGRDPHLKERLFGLTGPQGNHGESVKELYYYLENTPDHSYMRALYKYPKVEFPYQKLLDENKRRSTQDPEFGILDTGVFDGEEYWDIEVEYSQTSDGVLMCTYSISNRGTEKNNQLVVLPQFWFRNTWWKDRGSMAKPSMQETQSGHVQIDAQFGCFILNFNEEVGDRSGVEFLFTDNEDLETCPPDPFRDLYYKNAFHRFVCQGETTAINPTHQGTKFGAMYTVTVPAHGSKKIAWSLCPGTGLKSNILIPGESRLSQRDSMNTDKWNLSPGLGSEADAIVQQAVAGLLWNKQFYFYHVKEWREQFPYRRKEIEKRAQVDREKETITGTCSSEVTQIDNAEVTNDGQKVERRNKDWEHMMQHDILLMPDKWEFPWYASWDLAFQVIPVARFDGHLAKHQLLTLLSDRYTPGSMQIPGCEFDFSDPFPPIQAWSALKIYRRVGDSDQTFLRTCFNSLHCKFDSIRIEKFIGKGGFLGMDNISIVDRSRLPAGYSILQADATGWAAMLSLGMMEMALELSSDDDGDALARDHMWNFMQTAYVLNESTATRGLYHPTDSFYYDVMRHGTESQPILVRSLSGLVPLTASLHIKKNVLKKHSTLRLSSTSDYVIRGRNGDVLFTAVPLHRLKEIVKYLQNEKEFLSPFGIRSLSKYYDENPYTWSWERGETTLKYCPGESDSDMFGGNSNWRGPIWLCMNYILVESLETYGGFLSQNQSTSEFGRQLMELAKDITNRIVSIFMPDKDGNRPLHGDLPHYKRPEWKDLILFYEFFHSETGRGCGASHQTGWTALIIEFLFKLAKYKKQTEES